MKAFLSAAEDALDEIVEVPSDGSKLNGDTRLLLLKKINLCERKGELLDYFWILDFWITSGLSIHC